MKRRDNDDDDDNTVDPPSPLPPSNAQAPPKKRSKKDPANPNDTPPTTKDPEEEFGDGEIEITLHRDGSNAPPTALDLYQLAIQEREKPPPSSDKEEQRRIVIRLFEMALEAFDADPGNEDWMIHHANCLRDLGAYLPHDAFLERSLEVVGRVVEGRPGEAEGWVALGMTRLERLRRLQGVERGGLWDGEEEDDDDDDDEEEEEEKVEEVEEVEKEGKKNGGEEDEDEEEVEESEEDKKLRKEAEMFEEVRRAFTK
ncbi:hypothetical protein HDU67_001974, partial [Dinochytrium kinnereticum]